MAHATVPSEVRISWYSPSLFTITPPPVACEPGPTGSVGIGIRWYAAFRWRVDNKTCKWSRLRYRFRIQCSSKYWRNHRVIRWQRWRFKIIKIEIATKVVCEQVGRMGTQRIITFKARRKVWAIYVDVIAFIIVWKVLVLLLCFYFINLLLFLLSNWLTMFYSVFLFLSTNRLFIFNRIRVCVWFNIYQSLFFHVCLRYVSFGVYLVWVFVVFVIEYL